MMRAVSTVAHLRTLRLTDHLVGFYDGRVPGQTFMAGENWVDDGALELGVCSYALVDGGEALVYDTHISVPHAAAVRQALEAMGASRITVVLSHSHLDHIAGTEAFADCEILANELTTIRLADDREAIEAGTQSGPPAIAPLVMPTRTFDGRMSLEVGSLGVELVQFDIHSRDGTVLRAEADGILLAGDTLEDTVTYLSEPDGLARHLEELERLRAFARGCRIYPNHGALESIAGGGYADTFITATEEYITGLLRHARDPRPGDGDLRSFLAGPLAAGWVTYFAPYERVHTSNLGAVTSTPQAGG
jgi:glyoxylase-like metal-dependent hydrolase (beta-lactamase superfamily II)